MSKTDKRPANSYSRNAVAYPFRLFLLAILYPVKKIIAALRFVFSTRTGRPDLQSEQAYKQSHKRHSTSGPKHLDHFRRSEQQRRLEQDVAAKRERQILRGRGEEAERLREELADRQASFSRGEIVNHLAQVQRKARRSDKPSDE